MKKEWIHKVDIDVTQLEEELTALSASGYEIYKLWRVGYGIYEIVAHQAQR